jgi:predicted MFS family arabinose efflux permease
LAEPRYRLAFILTMLLPTGGYMLMPFGTAFIVGNVGLALGLLPTIYLVTGLCTVFVGPLVGKASDSYGKFNTFCFGTIMTVIMVAIWTNMGHAPLLTVIAVNVLLFIGIFSRMIPAQALMSAIPDVTKRGAFNAVSASLQQFAGGVSAAIAGAVIALAPNGALLHFNWLGGIVMGVALLSLTLMYFVHQAVPEPAPR